MTKNKLKNINNINNNINNNKMMLRQIFLYKLLKVIIDLWGWPNLILNKLKSIYCNNNSRCINRWLQINKTKLKIIKKKLYKIRKKNNKNNNKNKNKNNNRNKNNKNKNNKSKNNKNNNIKN